MVTLYAESVSAMRDGKSVEGERERKREKERKREREREREREHCTYGVCGTALLVVVKFKLHGCIGFITGGDASLFSADLEIVAIHILNASKFKILR